MNPMDSDQKFTISMTAIIAGALVTLILGSVVACQYHARSMARLGYEETVVAGHGDTVFQKAQK